MTVEAILQTKGRSVYSVDETATIKQVCDFLSEKRVGSALILSNKGEIAGIVSERDIVRAIAKNGADVFSQPASSIMTKEVVCCKEGDNVRDILSLMTNGRFRHMPVVEQGRLVGVISIGDVVKRRIEYVELERASMRDYIATG